MSTKKFHPRARPLAAALLLGLGVSTTALPARNNDASGALLPLRPATPAASAVATATPARAIITERAPAPAPAKPAGKPASKPAAASGALVPAAANAQSRCNEDDASASASAGRDAGMLELSDADPRMQLQSLVQTAVVHSRTVGVAKLLTEAAEADLAESKAQRMPTIGISGTAGNVGSIVSGVNDGRGAQGSAALSVTAPLYDSGHIAKLTEWRANLADAARFSQNGAEEQIALQTVSLALDRSRYILQAQVFKQYVRKMACLVEALNIITKADPGRSSELLQAVKSQQQADLSLVQTYSALRQTEVRLRRYVGDTLPPSAGLSSVLTQVPDLNEMQADILTAPDVAQADAQAKAQRSLAESVRAGQKPSVNLVVNATKAVGASNSVSWLGGVQVNVPLMIPGAAATVRAANKRFEAADMQRDDTVEAKRYRLLEMNEVAISTLDRARRIVELLRNSDRVRAATLQQWQELGRRSLFDVMAAEGDYYSNRIAHVNALFDAEQVVALIWSMGRGVTTPLR